MLTLQQHLQQTFKLQGFRPGQERVINALLAGRSALAVFPTGGGKSLCYQLPALMLDGVTLVVSPLIALMKDQVDQLHRLGIAAARLDSSVDAEQLQSIYRGLEDGSIKLLYVAPERLANERFLARLKRLSISMMAVDEAHCVSEWGHNFRPDYLKLAQLAKELEVGRVLALTATATPQVAQQICDSFAIAPADHVQTGFFRPNLALSVRPYNVEERGRALLEALQARPSEPAIVYVTLQKTATQVAALLSEQGLNAQAYHAGLKGEERHRVQEAFMSGQVNIVVATIAFGMGIDKADIRGIYHYNLPKSLENYMQEIGRAGRDGEPSQCVLLASSDDLTMLENFSYGDTPDSEALAGLIGWLMNQPAQFDLAVHELSGQFDVRPLVINTLLTYLELDGIIRSTAPFYTEYKLAFQISQAEVLAQFDHERADFLRQVFAAGKEGRIWLTLKPIAVADQLQVDRVRILKAIGYLEQQGMVEVRVAGVRQGYRMVNRPADPQALTAQIAEQFRVREQRDIQRLQQVCNWAQSSDCYQRGLVGYFGEQLPQPCGQCSACKGEHQRFPERHRTAPDSAVILAVIAQRHGALATPRQLARFLCGISSPRASRARLARHPSFGSQMEVPFAEVLATCRAMLEP
ncbi:ATP-dependent DNA helicase RecQ [Alcanivorax sp. NBRC 101098]|jgi:ATP-dependent DNA helicase RecQ|uniref:RecQ family ATP-dependent DNA helicase n=1 Tax=Alcanivorax TaxID=59753 RepID=UPI0004ABDA3E|nr:ATP-dependent DNA helicase RecQ [Alcanivorax sp. NBRC 101098]BAP14081.1 ATP-dependent DNA helicase RecQ [Alcanivorax sp. NBRC 101098]